MPELTCEYAILGAGAIGSILGAHLIQAGHSVLMIAREPRATQIDGGGLRIAGLVNLNTPARVLRHPLQLARAEVLIVALKATGTLAILQEFRPQAIGTAFSIQNGPGKNAILAQAFGREGVLGALADTSGDKATDGTVLFTRNVNLLIGELDGGLSSRAQRIAAALQAAGIRAAPVPDIMNLEWSKFCAWAGLMTVSITTRAPTADFLSSPQSALQVARLVRELGALAAALGFTLTDRSILPVASLCAATEEDAVLAVQRRGAEFRASAPHHRMSSLQDLEAGRPLEVENTLGYAHHQAQNLRMSLPLLDHAYQFTRQLGKGPGTAIEVKN